MILEDNLSTGQYEHDIPVPGKKYKRYVPCLQGLPGLKCPLCAQGDPRKYRMFLSVLDVRGYEKKNNGGTVPQIKRLLPINAGSSKEKEKWQKLCAQIKAKHGTCRGVYMQLLRPNEQQSSRIGEPEPIDGMLWQFMTQPELLQYYGHEARKADNGQVIAQANSDLVAHDYDIVFPAFDEKMIAAYMHEFGNGLPDASAGDYTQSGGGLGSADDIEEAWDGTETGGGYEIADGNDGSGEIDHTGQGALADTGDVEAQQVLTALAEANSIDTEQFADWQGVEDAIEHVFNPPKPAVKVAAKKVATKTAPATKQPAFKQAVKQVYATKTAPAAKKAPIAFRPNRQAFGRQ